LGENFTPKEFVMEEPQSAALLEYFKELADPRIERHKEHKLIDILVIAICAILCGANDWVAVETFGKAKREWFERFLALEHGIPSHDTFGRVFALVLPTALQACFLRWIQAVAEVTAGQVVAIDGKTLRHSYDRRSAKAAIHMVSAWATHNRVVLGQLKTAEKSNEITAIPALLKVLDVSGCIVTIDAMGCQKAIAQQIVDQEADYVLALKQNHETLYEAVVQQFAEARHTASENTTLQSYDTDERQHGRREIRRHWTLEVPLNLGQKDAWAQLHCLGMVESERHLTDEITIEHRYYIASIPNNVQQFAHAVRAHWGIENCVHWVLDVAFREDECRVRLGHGPENFAVLRHIALNLLRQDTRTKLGIHNKRLKAGWDDTYLATLVFGHVF
jgi:predicted transposase YbfD/YdcC